MHVQATQQVGIRITTRTAYLVAALVLLLGARLVAAQTLIGSYSVQAGPLWNTTLPTYSCVEACALLFGGTTGDYSCSTQSASVDHLAWGSNNGSDAHCALTYASTPGTPVAEDFKDCPVYASGCFSAYVQDNCYSPGTFNDPGSSASINYCFSTAVCGNGAVEFGEQCDDGNTVNGDCCDSGCQYEPNGSSCADATVCNGDEVCDGAGVCQPGVPLDCDDGNLCTQDSCDAGSGCLNAAVPRISGCKAAGKSLLLLKDNATDDSKDKLTFKWLKGAETTLGELGTPASTTHYALCLYAGTAVATVTVPAGANWQPLGTTGFKYRDPSGTGAPAGAQKAVLKSGAAGKSKVLVKGKGSNLPDDLVPALPLPVTAQLVNDVNSTCFSAVYTSGNVIKNAGKQFKAKVP
jgi:cysteine-rich repeat protein